MDAQRPGEQRGDVAVTAACQDGASQVAQHGAADGGGLAATGRAGGTENGMRERRFTALQSGLWLAFGQLVLIVAIAGRLKGWW
jgi:hypothetical protein